MSCRECNKAQQKSLSYYYRWKNANIEIRGCRKHSKEVMDALNKIQFGIEMMKPTDEPFEPEEPEIHGDNYGDR